MVQTTLREVQTNIWAVKMCQFVIALSAPIKNINQTNVDNLWPINAPYLKENSKQDRIKKEKGQEGATERGMIENMNVYNGSIFENR